MAVQQVKRKVKAERKARSEQKKRERIWHENELAEERTRNKATKGSHCKSHKFIEKANRQFTPLRLPVSKKVEHYERT